MPSHRVYIDESGDHRYRAVHGADDRFLALTAVIVRRERYANEVAPALEAVKRAHFSYDPDKPVIFTRSQIVKRKSWFGVLANQGRKEAFGGAILEFYRTLPAAVFTVVMDKQVHRANYPHDTFDPYEYSLEVLLNRIRGWFKVYGGDAEVVCECRGKQEDAQIMAAYARTRARGTRYASASEIRQSFPLSQLTMMRKHENVAGLQIADMACYGQKQRIIQEKGHQVGRISDFTASLNVEVGRLVNPYGHYMLE